MKQLTYLACPYTHADPAVRHARFEAANAAAAHLLNEGHIVYSPISHSHSIGVLMGQRAALDHVFWMRQCRAFLAQSNKLIVLTIDGWRESRGIRAEMQIADELGIEVRLMEPCEVRA